MLAHAFARSFGIARRHTRRAALLAVALVAGPVSGQILQVSGPSLNAYLAASPTASQGVSPMAGQRGTNIDGSLREASPLGWSIAGNPFGEEWNNNIRHGDVRLDTGTYVIAATDLVLPAPGFSWVVGRTYNSRQETRPGGLPVHYDSNGYQGYNWFQSSQPEVTLYQATPGTKQAGDVLYIVYGADRFIELKRKGGSGGDANLFVSINGSGGGAFLSEDPAGADLVTFIDQTGLQIDFYSPSDAQIPAKKRGQLWRMIRRGLDPASTTDDLIAYVGHKTDKDQALAAYDNECGGILEAYDTAGRKYAYTYTPTVAGKRLTKVEVFKLAGTTWTATGDKVEYAYYDGVAAGGTLGDLKLVRSTVPSNDVNRPTVYKSLYRYYGLGAYDSDPGSPTFNPGYPHALKIVVGAEGLRKRDYEDDKLFNESYLTLGDDELKKYSDAVLEYHPDGLLTQRQIATGWFNGQCGCAGGVNGKQQFAYESNPLFVNTAGYDQAWRTRTTVTPPAGGQFIIQYFDEASQALSRVTADRTSDLPTTYWQYGNGALSPPFWPMFVERDASGLIVKVAYPANFNLTADQYRHLNVADQPDGTFTTSSSGLVRFYDRRTTADAARGFVEAVRYADGDNQNPRFYERTIDYTALSYTPAPGLTIARPVIAADRLFVNTVAGTPTAADYDQVSYAYVAHAGDAALAPKSITTIYPVVTTDRNGSGVADQEVEYRRPDGTLVFEKAADGVVTYRQHANGMIVKMIEDANTSVASDFAAGDAPANYGVSSFGIPVRRITQHTRDEQGREQTRLSYVGTADAITARWFFTTLDDQRLVEIYAPKQVLESVVLTTASTTPSTIEPPATITSPSNPPPSAPAGSSAVSAGPASQAVTPIARKVLVWYGPVSYRISSHIGELEFDGTVALTNNRTEVPIETWIFGNVTLAANDWLPLKAFNAAIGRIARLETMRHSKSGKLVLEDRKYFSIATPPDYREGAEGNPVGPSNFDARKYCYDDNGRKVRTAYTSGTIVRVDYDPRGLPVFRHLGTEDDLSVGEDGACVSGSGGGSDGAGRGSSRGTPNMQQIWAGTYDHGGGGYSALRGTPTCASMSGCGGPGGAGPGGGGPGGGAGSGSDCCNVLKMDSGCFDDDRSVPIPRNQMYRDVRGSILVTEKRSNSSGGESFIVQKLDARRRVIAIGVFNADAAVGSPFGSNNPSNPTGDDPLAVAAGRMALTEFKYDQRGRLFRTVRHRVDIDANGNGTFNPANALTDDRWFDPEGRTIKVKGQNLEKLRYDRLGRLSHQFILAKDNDASYAALYAPGLGTLVNSDIVLEERQTIHAAVTGDVVLSAIISRRHNDYGAGETIGALDANTSGTPLTLEAADLKGRARIRATWFDYLRRPVTSADYGTNGGVTFNRSATTEPTASAAGWLVRRTIYDNAGSIASEVNDKGIRTDFVYDDADRLVRSIENPVTGTPGAITDQDRVTEYTFGYHADAVTGLKGMKRQIIVRGVTAADDQVTTYWYGTLGGAPLWSSLSAVATGHLLSRIDYPQSSSATPIAPIRFGYDRAGKLRTVLRIDATQDTVLVAIWRDKLGRETRRFYSDWAISPDLGQTEIQTEYDALGRVKSVRELSQSGDNVVGMTYDGWGNLASLAQDFDGPYSGTTNPAVVTFTNQLSTAGRITTRRTQMAWAGATLDYKYSADNGRHDNQASRVSNISMDAVELANYEYLGEDTVVETNLPESGLSRRRFDPSTLQYTSLDQFDRITSDRWTRQTGNPLRPTVAVYDSAPAYDYNSNIVLVDEKFQPTKFDVKYDVDRLDRLQRTLEGDWNGTKIVSPSRDEQWTLGTTGNWTSHKLDLNGNGTFTDAPSDPDNGEYLEDNPDAQSATPLRYTRNNQLVSRRVKDASGTSDIKFSYDDLGSTKDDGRYIYVHDIQGRIIYVKDRDTQSIIAEYAYNGLGYRIGVHYDANGDGQLDANDPWYLSLYDDRWRVIATYVTATPGSGGSSGGRGGRSIPVGGGGTALFDPAKPKERFVYHAAGRDGLGSASYIDDVVLRDRDNTYRASEPGQAQDPWLWPSDGVLEERLYYVQNWRHDVVATLTAGGRQLEHVRYSSYGVPMGLPAGDMDANGATDLSDVSAISAIASAGQYDARADVNLDGVVDSTDIALVQSNLKSLGRGRLSDGVWVQGVAYSGLRNRKGYAGYEWSPISTDTARFGRYFVRNRVYAPEIGRWLSRDPIGDLLGELNSYEYVNGMPTSLLDPMGLYGISDWWHDMEDGWDELKDTWKDIIKDPNPIKKWDEYSHDKEGIQDVQDAIHCCEDFIPGSGEILGPIDTALDIYKGDYTNAGVSIACSLVPGGGGPKGPHPGVKAPSIVPFPKVGPGSKGGPGAGKPFPPSIKIPPGTKCSYCGKKPATQRDHIHPKSRGGNNSRKNMAPACGTCNPQKGAKTPKEHKKWLDDNDLKPGEKKTAR